MVEVSGASHRYGRHLALDNVSLTVDPHEVVCVVGPSGCGKSTLLRLISGLETLQSGLIRIGGAVVAAPGRSAPPERRPTGMMFQDYALFPHLTAADNIAFGLRGRPMAERERRVAELLDLVALRRYADAYPHTLSGGQQQRIALARAMARNPAVLLLDEPFSALDEQMRRSVREEVMEIISGSGIATLVVTHDAEEAMHIGRRILVLAEGRVVQDDTPLTLYRSPANSFVAQLFGELNHLPAEWVDGALVTPFGPAPCSLPPAEVEVACRVEDVAVGPPGDVPDGVRVKVRSASFLGASTRLCLSLPASGRKEGAEIHARLPGHVALRAGEDVVASVPADRLMLFPRTGLLPKTGRA